MSLTRRNVVDRLGKVLFSTHTLIQLNAILKTLHLGAKTCHEVFGLGLVQNDFLLVHTSYHHKGAVEACVRLEQLQFTTGWVRLLTLDR